MILDNKSHATSIAQGTHSDVASSIFHFDSGNNTEKNWSNEKTCFVADRHVWDSRKTEGFLSQEHRGASARGAEDGVAQGPLYRQWEAHYREGQEEEASHTEIARGN